MVDQGFYTKKFAKDDGKIKRGEGGGGYLHPFHFLSFHGENQEGGGGTPILFIFYFFTWSACHWVSIQWHVTLFSL